MSNQAMTNDKQVDRLEFEAEISKVIPALNFIWHVEGGQYLPFDTQLCWLTWHMSKRSMQPIELPQEDFLVGSGGQVDAIYFCNQIKDAITASIFICSRSHGSSLASATVIPLGLPSVSMIRR